MSIDFMVFSPEAAPSGGKAFRRWYGAQTDWAEDNDDYCDPTITAPAVQSWYRRMTAVFPDSNQPDVDPAMIDETYGDYNFGPHICYVAFRSSVVEKSEPLLRSIATECGLGVYDPNSDDERSDRCIQLPAGHSPSDTSPPRRRLFGILPWGK